MRVSVGEPPASSVSTMARWRLSDRASVPTTPPRWRCQAGKRYGRGLAGMLGDEPDSDQCLGSCFGLRTAGIAALGRIPRHPHRRLRLQPLVRALPQLGSAAVADHATGARCRLIRRDYAGQTMEVVDGSTGQLRTAQVFVPCWARRTTPTPRRAGQSLPDWIGSHVSGTGAGDRDVSPAAATADRVRDMAAPTLLTRMLRTAMAGPRRER